uniref:Uncharacterized protein n=1 Tax=Romanomermis culicivorax TaxID=13658 RepID=A0A915HVG0_ROMCU
MTRVESYGSNILNYYGSTYVPLDKGLYLCYVKLHSSTNQINIVVPENLPSVLPFFYIRDNPHVSKEEWDWLRKLESGECDHCQPTPTQLAFHWSLSSAAQILLGDLQVGRRETADHRIFIRELVEVHPDVTFILLLPPNNDVCSAPGHQWAGQEEKRGCFALPVPIFEL